MAQAGYFEEYRCGCVSEFEARKKDLCGYCPTHGEDRRHVHHVPRTKASRVLSAAERGIPDSVLIDLATTCSNRQVALGAEMELRRKNSSKKATALLKGARADCLKGVACS